MDCWSVGMGRRSLRDVRPGLAGADRLAEEIADRARQAFAAV
jgi:hypothetical protein